MFDNMNLKQKISCLLFILIVVFGACTEVEARMVDNRSILDQLGYLSQKYESGTSGAGTVSTGKGDPGGVSYGTYQLSSTKGTAATFVRQMGYTTTFKGSKPGSATFSHIWRELAKDESFGEAQHEFIKRTHYDPIRRYADSIGIVNHPIVNQVLWSIGVQHGKAKTVVSNATMIMNNSVNVIDTINALYKARVTYVKKIRLPASTLKSLINRYNSERRDAFIMLVGHIVKLEVSYWDYSGERQVGILEVSVDVQDDIEYIFSELYKAEFPINKIQTIDHYSGDDIASMADNNTSAYNYRVIAGTDKLSNHSYGLAIDINPLTNPYVGGTESLDWSLVCRLGGIYRDGLVYKLFTERGWTWGGDWVTVKDYQHFEKVMK